ncbi:unnamed protein product [marine sediment metagenome]|uniref:Uncharacterized protein n=1 Tax=marine sediment metagenome TaxID=412755 RepID=X0UW10_9ZZZZ
MKADVVKVLVLIVHSSVDPLDSSFSPLFFFFFNIFIRRVVLNLLVLYFNKRNVTRIVDNININSETLFVKLVGK